MTDEPLIGKTDALADKLLDLAEGDTVPFAEKLSLFGRLTAYLQVKHRLEDPKDGKVSGFDRWREHRKEEGDGAGSDRPRRGKRARKPPANPFNPDTPTPGITIAKSGRGYPDDRSIPGFGVNSGGQIDAAPVGPRGNDPGGNGDAGS